MSEQWTWEPVIEKRVMCACGNPGCYKALVHGIGWIAIVADVSDKEDDRQLLVDVPDDLRLCRRVPAPAQGVPPEMLGAIRRCASTVKYVYHRQTLKDVTIEDATIADRVERWLDAQPQPGQEGDI